MHCIVKNGECLGGAFRRAFLPWRNEIIEIKTQRKDFYHAANPNHAFFQPYRRHAARRALIAQGLAEEITEVDLSLPQGKAMHFEEKDIVLIAGPVFGGRMPACFWRCLPASQAAIQRQLQSPSMGNRAYEDALLELNDTVERRGFQSIASGCAACGAFHGSHGCGR